MAFTFTHTVIAGNITHDPRIIQNRFGRPMTILRVASDWHFKDQNGEWKSGDTVFIDVQTFGTLAENCAHSLRKGNSVVVVGRLTSNEWESEREGTPLRVREMRIRATQVAVDLNRHGITIDHTLRAGGGAAVGSPPATARATARFLPEDVPANPWALDAHLPSGLGELGASDQDDELLAEMESDLSQGSDTSADVSEVSVDVTAKKTASKGRSGRRKGDASQELGEALAAGMGVSAQGAEEDEVVAA